MAETTPLSLSLAGESPGNPDASGGLQIAGHSPSQRDSASHSQRVWWLLAPWGLPLLGLRPRDGTQGWDPGMGLRGPGCGMGAGTGWAGVGGNILQTKNGLNEIVSHGNQSLGCEDERSQEGFQACCFQSHAGGRREVSGGVP